MLYEVITPLSPLQPISLTGSVKGCLFRITSYNVCYTKLLRGGLKSAMKPQVVLGGSGTPKREFLHVDDMAAASVFVMGMEQRNNFV